MFFPLATPSPLGTVFKYIDDAAMFPCGGTQCHHCETETAPIFNFDGEIVNPDLAANPQLARDEPEVSELCADCILGGNIRKDITPEIQKTINRFAADADAAMAAYCRTPSIALFLQKMLGTEDWQVGLSNVTMQKLADAVDAQKNGTSGTVQIDSAAVQTIRPTEGMGPPLTDATVRRLDMLFAPECRHEATRLLENECGNNLPFLEDSTAEELERFRFAALKISNGRIEDLRKAVELAKADWRDLLMSAGFGEDPTAHSRWMPSGNRPTDSGPKSK